MSRPIKTVLIIFAIAFFASSGFAEENPWEEAFTQALQKGKISKAKKTGAYGYTLTEEEILKKAMKKAMKLKAPPCEAMKIAVALKYNADSVIKNIFSSGGEVDLNQLCMCATEKDVTKQAFAQMATDAKHGNKPVFSPDEIAEAQCIREIGLGYGTTSDPDPIPPGPTPNPESTTATGTGPAPAQEVI